MAESTDLDPVGVENERGVDEALPGDLVRELVARNEETIDSLLARLAAAERLADESEQSVRDHPGVALLTPEEAIRLVPEPSTPTVVDDGRPRTTVVERTAPVPPPRRRARSSVGSPERTATDDHAGFVARLTRSHLWWRIGIVLVAVALLLVKFG